jgi:hypothetical protein
MLIYLNTLEAHSDDDVVGAVRDGAVMRVLKP